MLNGTVLVELRKIASTEKDELVMAESVVKAAEKENSPLHEYFEWDDSIASHQFRLMQARRLIARIEIVDDDSAETMRPAFVSLNSDRKGKGGYRAIGKVLSDNELRKQLLETALSELKAIQKRHSKLTELATVFKEVDRIAKRVPKKV